MRFDEDFLGKAATQVKEAYLDNGTPPTEEVSKIATEHELSIEQVKRVCEESNKSIKVATKATDPQKVFPVADYTVVLEGINMKMALKKEADVGEEEKEELYGYGGLAAMPQVDKAAQSEEATAHMSGHHKTIFLGVKRAERAMDERLIKKEAEIKKVIGSMIETLYKEARANKNLNGSYSNLMKCATTAESRNHIHNFYHFAAERMGKVSSFLINKPLTLMDKSASMVNPSSSLVRNMNSYMELRAQSDKIAALREVLRDKLETFSRRAIEED